MLWKEKKTAMQGGVYWQEQNQNPGSSFHLQEAT